jgi:UDP-N-acetyl-D-glucosamine dehydrogenase
MNPVATPAELIRADAHSTAADINVAVVGMGYVGLPTAIALGVAGHPVIGLDISDDRLRAIADGEAELLDHEQVQLADQLDASSLLLTSDPTELAAADAIIIAVPTPVDDRRQPDLRPLRGACNTVVAFARAGQTIILTSTTSIGSTRQLLVEPLERRGLTVGEDVFVAFAPERIDPGVKAHAQQATPRVVGGVTEECFKRAANVLRHTCSEVHAVSSAEAAELAKLMENTFRATNIALSFEFAEAARRYGLDAVEVIDAAKTKPYAFMAHYPSAGVGGHCIPVDPYYLLEPLRAEGVHMPVIAASMEQVSKRPGRFAQRALAEVSGLDDPRVLVVNATYKSGVADLRESAALEIIRDLRMAGVHVDYHDPLAGTFVQDGIRFHSVAPSAEGYDVAILTLVHPGQDLSWLHNCPVVIDGTYRTPVGARREVI